MAGTAPVLKVAQEPAGSPEQVLGLQLTVGLALTGSGSSRCGASAPAGTRAGCTVLLALSLALVLRQILALEKHKTQSRGRPQSRLSLWKWEQSGAKAGASPGVGDAAAARAGSLPLALGLPRAPTHSPPGAAAQPALVEACALGLCLAQLLEQLHLCMCCPELWSWCQEGLELWSRCWSQSFPEPGTGSTGLQLVLTLKWAPELSLGLTQELVTELPLSLGLALRLVFKTTPAHGRAPASTLERALALAPAGDWVLKWGPEQADSGAVGRSWCWSSSWC